MQDARRRGRPRWVLWAAVALVVAATLAVFVPALSAGLVNWDDEPGIARNHGFRGLDLEHLAWMFTTNTLGHYQPLSWLSLALDHALWGLSPGLEPPEIGRWHLTSVLLHAATAVLFGLLALRVLRRAAPGASDARVALAALFAALFFALHPLRAESVAWLTERRDVLSGGLMVSALLAWWRGVEPPPGAPRLGPGLASALAAAVAVAAALAALDLASPDGLRWGRGGPVALGLALLALFVAAMLAARVHPAGRASRALRVAAVGLCLLSLGAKAWAIVMPALLLLVDVWPLGRLTAPGATRSRRAFALLLEKAPFVALTVLFARLAAWAQGSLPATMVGLEAHTPVERGVQGLYGLAWYPLKTLLPAGLTPYVELPAELSLAAPRFALAAVGVVAVTVAVVLSRRRAPGILAAGAAFAVIVSPVLGVAQSGPQLVADRYSYLSGLPLALLAGGGLAWLAGLRPALAPWLAVGAAAWLAALGIAGQRQAAVWRSSASLWEHALSVDSHSGFAAQKLAQVRLAESGAAREPAERARLVGEALELLERLPRPEDPVWLSTSSMASLERARLEPARRVEHLARAVELARRSVDLRGEATEPDLRLNLATALIEAGRPAEALGELERYTRARPLEALGWANLGVALAASGRPRDALEPLERAVALEPGYAKGWQFLGQAREAVGDREGALEAWRRVLDLWPRSEQARDRLRALGG